MLYEDIELSPSNAPKFKLEDKEIDIWSEPYAKYCGIDPVEYVREAILESERHGVDCLNEIVGKSRVKALIKQALFSGSPILFKGKRGYGKTTLSKAVMNLLPKRILSVSGCPIFDDPKKPVCFTCKKRVMEDNAVELSWTPTPWVRISGDPMMTTRQLIGGISIQKIREGFDLNDSEVFLPGRVLRANRGICYFDELGAIPTSLQTLLLELFEEQQVTVLEGEIVPFRIHAVEMASTNPANYQGTNPIKEPLLDRMEEIEVGPPETLEEEIEIGKKNMNAARSPGYIADIPEWHFRILARTVRLARESQHQIAKDVEIEPSCRATIRLFDHLNSRTMRKGHNVPMLSDYDDLAEVLYLALGGRIVLKYGTSISKQEIIRRLFEESVETTLKEVYDKIPSDTFDDFTEELGRFSEGGRISISESMASKLKESSILSQVIRKVFGNDYKNDYFLSALELILRSISACAPQILQRKQNEFMILSKVSHNEA